MALNEEIMEQAFRYLSGEMSEEESAAFEAVVEENAELKEQLRMLGELDDVLLEDDWTVTEFDTNNEKAKAYFEHFNQEENKAFYEQLKEIEVASSEHAEKPATKGLLRWLGRAAVLALLGVFSYVLLFNQPSANKLYANHVDYQTLGSFTQKSAEDNALAEAEQAFKAGDFSTSIPLFEAYLNSGKENYRDLVKVYLALAEAENKNYERALSLLNPIALDNNSLLQQRAQFYEAMVTLKSGDKAGAKQLLEVFADQPNHVFGAEAKRIAKRLK